MSLNLSYTAYSTYTGCPLQYKKKYIDRQRPDFDTAHWFVFGEAWHSMLEQWYRNKIYKRSWLEAKWPIFLSIVAKRRNVEFSPKTKEIHLNDGTRCIENFISVVKDYKLLDNAPIVESKFKFQLPTQYSGTFSGIEIPFINGKIDLILHKVQLEPLLVIDHKAGKSKPSNLDQLLFYCLGVEKLYGFPDRAAFLMPRQKAFIDYSKDELRTELHSNFLPELKRCVEGILSKSFEAKGEETGTCTFCAFERTCEARAAKAANFIQDLTEGEITL